MFSFPFVLGDRETTVGLLPGGSVARYVCLSDQYRLDHVRGSCTCVMHYLADHRECSDYQNRFGKSRQVIEGGVRRRKASVSIHSSRAFRTIARSFGSKTKNPNNNEFKTAYILAGSYFFLF